MEGAHLDRLLNGRKLIAITPNPVLKNAEQLGLDELVSYFFSTGGTLVASGFTSNPMILAGIGPLSEKPAFFLRHLYEAKKSFNAAKAKGEEATFRDHLVPEMKSAAKSLWMDVAFHDSSYFAFASVLMSTSTAPPALLATVAFMAAVPAAAVLETCAEGLLHRGLKGFTARSGVEWETYLESRFLYDGDAEALQSDLAKRYGLQSELKGEYHDYYLKNRLLSLAERNVLARKRKISGDVPRDSVEMVFTTTQKISPDDSEHNYFVTRKEKGKFVIEDSPAWHVSLPYLLRRSITREVEKPIDFSRRTFHDSELSVCVDTLPESPRVIEVKVFDDRDKLVDALLYLKGRYDVLGTTLPKSELVSIVRNI